MNTKLVSPQGISAHSWLTRPDTYLDPQGWFSVDLVVQKNNPEVNQFISALAAIRDQHFQDCLSGKVEVDANLTMAMIKKLPVQDGYYEVTDRKGESTGEICFKFKIRAVSLTQQSSQQNGLSRSPAQYDRLGRRLPIEEEHALIPDGSTLRIGCEGVPHVSKWSGVGMRLTLLAVQVCKLAILPQHHSFEFPAS
jgi:hypothetical protein